MGCLGPHGPSSFDTQGLLISITFCDEQELITNNDKINKNILYILIFFELFLKN